MTVNEQAIETLIRNVIARQLGSASSAGFEKTVDKQSGVLSIKAASVKPAPFDTGKPGDRVFLTDVLTLEESPRLGCGIMEMEASAFEWTLMYDEIDYVIDGTLEIVINGRRIVGNRGDIILIPKNTAISFSAPSFARFIYVTYPADWESQ